MVDGTLVYHRGFGDRQAAVKDPKPSLFVSPLVFLHDGSVAARRTYPLMAAVPACTGGQGSGQSRPVPCPSCPLDKLLP
jgi:hypothetical protein